MIYMVETLCTLPPLAVSQYDGSNISHVEASPRLPEISHTRPNQRPLVRNIEPRYSRSFKSSMNI